MSFYGFPQTPVLSWNSCWDCHVWLEPDSDLILLWLCVTDKWMLALARTQHPAHNLPHFCALLSITVSRRGVFILHRHGTCNSQLFILNKRSSYHACHGQHRAEGGVESSLFDAAHEQPLHPAGGHPHGAGSYPQTNKPSEAFLRPLGRRHLRELTRSGARTGAALSGGWFKGEINRCAAQLAAGASWQAADQ